MKTFKYLKDNQSFMNHQKILKAHKKRQEKKHLTQLELRSIISDSPYCTAYDLSTKIGISPSAIADNLAELIEKGELALLQVPVLNRFQNLYYIPEKIIDNRIILPGELIHLLQWNSEKKLFFIACSCNYFIIRSKFSEIDYVSLGILKVSLKTDEDNRYYIRLPYNWLMFYRIENSSESLNKFTTNGASSDSFLMYSANSSDKIVSLTPPHKRILNT